MDQPRTIARVELYERVWTTPMQKLANEFGLSDVGLAKLCRRHQIPVPGRGYWTRLQFGQKPGRTPLPKNSNLAIENITMVLHEKRPSKQAALKPDQPVPAIEVSENHAVTHPLVLRIDKSILRGKKDERGLPLARLGRVLPVHVSLESLARALRILDVLFASIDDAGHKMLWPSPYGTSLSVIVLDEKIGVSLSEVVKRNQHTITEGELSRQKLERWWTPPRWDYTHTGRLKFSLESIEASHIQHTWTDARKQKLESCVGEMLMCFETMAKAVKKYREDCAEAERQRVEEQKQAERRRHQEAEYDRKIEVVGRFAQRWREANQLREFAAALKESARSPGVSDVQKLGVLRILDWIERHANYADPLTDVTDVICEFDRPSWQWS